MSDERPVRGAAAIPTSSDGFLKTTGGARTMDGSQKAALIRRGNELFNAGDIETATRIFVTVRYSDGLIRVGNHLFDRGETLDAFRLFWLAGDRRRVEELSEKMAQIVRKWLRDDAQ